MLFCAFQVQAADQYLHVNVGGGLNDLNYKVSNGTQKGFLGGTFNLGYSSFFNEHWGAQFLIGVQSLSSQSSQNYMISIPNSIDSDNELFEYRAYFKNVKEKQVSYTFDMPLTLQYRHSINEEIGFLSGIGMMVSMPVYSNYSTSGVIKETGYYASTLAELDDLEIHGFKTHYLPFTGNVNLKPFVSAVFNVGLLYNVSDDIDLYAGTYFNYALNNSLAPDTKSQFLPGGIYNSVLTTSQVDMVKPISFGIKVGAYFHLPEYIPGGKSDLEKPKTRIDKVVIPSKPPQVVKIAQRGKVVDAQEILAARRAMQERKRKDSIDAIYLVKPNKQIVNQVVSEQIVPKVAKQIVLDTVVKVKQPKLEKRKKPIVVDRFIKPESKDTAALPIVPQVRTENKVNTVTPLPEPIVEDDAFTITKKMAESFDIKFMFSSIEMVEPDMERVKALCDFLKLNPNIGLRIIGHTDNVSSFRTNLILGNKRAEVVKQMFIDCGVPATSIYTKSRSYLEPLVPNTSEENKAQNRRATMTVQKIRYKPKMVVPSKPVVNDVSAQQVDSINKQTIKYERILFGRNLAQISLKHYGSREFWVYVYEANRDKLQHPGKIPFGTLNRVPKLDATLIDLNNPECLDKARALQELYNK